MSASRASYPPSMAPRGSGAVSYAVSFSRLSVDLRVRCYDTDAQDLLVSVDHRINWRLSYDRSSILVRSHVTGNDQHCSPRQRPFRPLHDKLNVYTLTAEHIQPQRQFRVLTDEVLGACVEVFIALDFAHVPKMRHGGDEGLIA